jgi:hypothetical protein
MAAQVDFGARQQVEGFASVLSDPNRDYFVIGGGVQPDMRGPSRASMTRDWARPPKEGEPDLEWQTAPAPQAVDSTFSFVGESANLPENAFPPNQATLYADDQAVITFDLGLRQRQVWSQGDWALEFTPKIVNATVDGYHRHTGRGVCGVYRLAAPASALRHGQPLRLKVILLPKRCDVITWFGVRHRSDTLEVSPRTNNEQIAQLQQEIIHLKRVVGALARRSYPDLFPERLATDDVIVYTNGNTHVHPPDVLLLQNGDLLACFREATEHIAVDGKIVMVRSRDGGRTWGERQVLRQHPHTDDRECSLAQLRDGAVLAAHWPNRYYDIDGYYVRRITHDLGRPFGMYVGISTDNGHTFTWPDTPIDPAPFHAAVTSERIIETRAGRLLMACYFWPLDQKHYGSAVFCSDDKGRTWRYLSTVADVPGVRLSEPALIETRTGRLVCIMRNEDDALYYQANSDDSGETWTPAMPTPIPGHHNPASLVSLADGTVLCVYGSRGDPSGIYVVASYDDGATWDIAGRRVLRDDFPNLDACYPSTALMPDGRVFTVYYFNMFGRFFIAGSFFRWDR